MTLLVKMYEEGIPFHTKISKEVKNWSREKKILEITDVQRAQRCLSMEKETGKTSMHPTVNQSSTSTYKTLPFFVVWYKQAEADKTTQKR